MIFKVCYCDSSGQGDPLHISPFTHFRIFPYQVTKARANKLSLFLYGEILYSSDHHSRPVQQVYISALIPGNNFVVLPRYGVYFKPGSRDSRLIHF